MRFRARHNARRIMVPAAMALVGLIIVVIAIPPSLLLLFSGFGLMAGAFWVYQNS